MPAPGGLRAIAWGGEYRIALTGPAGDTVRVVERDLPARAITDAEWRGEEARFRQFLDRIPGAQCEPGSLPRPAHGRLLETMFFDEAGRTWVERQADGGRAWDVHDADGRLLAQLAAPDRIDRVPPVVRGDRLYVATADSLGIESVRVFEILAGR